MPARGRRLRSIDKEPAIDWLFIRLFKIITNALWSLDIYCWSQTYRIKNENQRNEDPHAPIESDFQILKKIFTIKIGRIVNVYWMYDKIKL